MGKYQGQKEFEQHCTEWLNMSVHLPIARDQYHLAYDSESSSYKKENAGMRAMNLYLLNELKKVGAEGWKKDKDGKKPPVRKIKTTPLTDSERDAIAGKPKGKYKGPSILEMAGLN